MLEKIILEIGMNHLGDIESLNRLSNYIIKKKISYVTLQFREDDFYKKSINKKYIINPDLLVKQFNILRKKNIKIGFAVADTNYKKFVNNYIPDFFKVLSWSANDLNLLSYLNQFNIDIYVSLGMLSHIQIKDLNQQIDKIFKNDKKNFKYIYTQLNYNTKDLNLNYIHKIREFSDHNISYGHHSKENEIPLYLALSFNIDKIFIYIKEVNDKIYPDNDHAYSINQLEELFNNMNLCLEYLGDKEKKTSVNEIEKIKEDREI